MAKRHVAIGERIVVTLPHSEVCMHMRVAGQPRAIEVRADGAQILNADGSQFSSPIGHGEAGLYRDSEGLYVIA
jgi:hypothetical protein